MLKLSKSAIEEMAENAKALIINRMTEEELAELKKNDDLRMCAYSFSKVGTTTATLYADESGRVYLEYGQPSFGW